MKKVIAVFGSPHSGKSTLSLAIAASLATKKKDVIVLSGDKVSPMLKVYAPLSDTPQSMSVGNLLMESDITEKAVTERIIIHPKSDRLGFMGMATGDNITTYPSRFIDERVASLFAILYRLCDYLVVDCTSNPMVDNITLKALEAAHVMVRLTTPDMVGLEFWRGMVGILKDERFKQAFSVPAINPARPISPVAEVQKMQKALLGDIKYVFPYSYEVEDRMMAGRLVKWLGRKEGIAFETMLEKLVNTNILHEPKQEKG